MTHDIKPGAIINADCLTVLRQMESGSVDMIITDPPYGMDYQSTRAAKENRKAKIANDKSPFIWWIYDAYRVLKEGGGYATHRIICPRNGARLGLLGQRGAYYFRRRGSA